MITLNQSSRTYLGSKPAWYGATVVAASYPYLEGRCIGPRYVSNSALPARACTHAGTNSDGAASSFVGDTSVPGPGRAVQRGCVQTRRNLQLPRDPAAPLRTRPKISLAFRAGHHLPRARSHGLSRGGETCRPEPGEACPPACRAGGWAAGPPERSALGFRAGADLGGIARACTFSTCLGSRSRVDLLSLGECHGDFSPFFSFPLAPDQKVH